MKKSISTIIGLLATIALFAQADRWQQRALYQMDINMDVETHRLQGTQRIVYFNKDYVPPFNTRKIHLNDFGCIKTTYLVLLRTKIIGNK